MRQIGDTILVLAGRKCDHCARGPIRIITDAQPKRRSFELTEDHQAQILCWVKCQACRTTYQKKILYDTFPAADSPSSNSLGDP